jgi:peptide-methionine (S)-S-oxide reductase
MRHSDVPGLLCGCRHTPVRLWGNHWGLRTIEEVMKTFVLGGGCFWCLDAVYQRTIGVNSVVSGYTGGHIRNPDYYEVCSGMTGHAEVVAVTFDENLVPEEVILDMFFALHDPTTLNRQGYDVGTQYRSSMFYTSTEEKILFEDAIDRNQQLWNHPIVTEVSRLGDFYEAEEIHQNYYAKYPEQGYCQVIINPKLAKARKYYSAWLNA